jgi:type I restriction enzyme, S subunit
VSFPRYPRYKDSGVEWLGEVPEHWDVSRLKHLAHVLPSNVDKKSYEGETPVRLCNYTDVYYNETITSVIDFMPATASADQIERFTLRADDTIITKDSETADDIAIAAYVPDDLPGVVCGYHLAVVRPHARSQGRFIKRLFDSSFAKACFAVRANGLTRVGLSLYELDNLLFAFPPTAEQNRIADFLDGQTAKIDALIGEQQRLIELLKEKRQTVISHAVTKGLNPDAPMRPSGIEWLGEIPIHWDSAMLTRVAKRVVVGIAEAATYAYVDEGVPILRSTNIRPGRIAGEVLQIAPEFSEDRGSKRIEARDLVTVRTGNAGVTAVIPEHLAGCQCFTMLITTLESGHSPEFYSYWMNSTPAQAYFTLEGWGTAQVNISVPILKALPVPIPPRSEQLAIVAHLDRETKSIDSLIGEAERAIALLHERRAALISAAVTGKIDVRGLVPA